MRTSRRGAVAGVRARIHDVRYGFLFLPGAVAALVAASAPLLLAIDRTGGGEGVGIGFHAEPDAARTVLATIAGSLITVAGLTFSITIVSLQLVSQQFSPRALRGFLGDRLNQVVVGTFIGTFVYCVLVLRTVTEASDERETFVPALSISVAVVLAVASIALLLVFIHHMARTIQVSSIAAGIAEATLSSLDPLYADSFGVGSEEDPDDLVRAWGEQHARYVVHPRRAGYVQSVALEDLPSLASTPDVRARVVHAPGDFVTQATRLVEYWADERDESFEQAILRAVSVQNERDMHQDVAFGLRQLADIALKAISPGVNDPTTAVTCIGYIREILEHLAVRPIPRPVRRYGDGAATLVARARPWEDYLETALVELGRYAAPDARVAVALLAAAAAAARAAARAGMRDRLDALRAVAGEIAERANAAASAADRAAIASALADVESVR